MAKQEQRAFGIRDKVGYALGDFGCNLSFQLISSYMYLFYTQCIKLSALHWAWIIIVSKVWDAINDILIGMMIDRTTISKKSKFKPWITIGSVGIVALTIMTFAPVSSLSDLGKILWCLASYCLWSVAYTMTNVPYGSMHSVITSDLKGRTSLSTCRSIGAAGGALLVMLLPKIVYENNVLSEKRMLIVAAVFSIGAFILLNAMRMLVTERVPFEPSKQKQSYFSAIGSYFSNRSLVAVTIATIAAVAFFNSTASANNLVFQFYFGDADKATIGTIAAYIPMVILMPLIGVLVAKLGKKRLISLSALIGAVSGVVMLILPIKPDTTGMIIYICGLMLLNIGNAVFQIIVWAIIADCIELSFKKRGVREESSLYALYSFFRKLSQGIGQALIAAVLSAVGYVETQSQQTAQVAANIKNVYIAFLLAGSLIVFISMTFIYNIDKRDEASEGDADKSAVAGKSA